MHVNGFRALSVENISGTVGGIRRTFQRIDNAAFSRPQKMKKSTQRRPTMTDIAKLTGVSQSTVSLVLNNATGAKFSDTTRNKVLKAAQDLGYRMTTREPLDAAIRADTKNRSRIFAHRRNNRPHPAG